MTGDSFVYGWLVGENETIGSYLEHDLGPDSEVYNMAARGYGLDQMALVATELAPQYHPELIVIAFIADDLARSCYSFNFNMRKPYFVMNGEGIEVRGIPVAVPDQVHAGHQTSSARAANWLITMAVRSRLVCLAGQVALQDSYRGCLVDLNPSIMRDVQTKLSPSAKVAFVHLDGELPPGFEAKVRSWNASFLSVPPLVERLSRELGVRPERHPDGHPKAPLNRVYARAIAQMLRESGNW